MVMEINITDFLKVWEMYRSNLIFWIVAIPLLVILVLWLWNVFNRQLEASGLKRLIPRFVSFAKKMIFNHRTEYRYAMAPSPKSGSPVNFWNDIVIWPVLMSPIIVFIAFNTTIPHLSLRWWTIVGWTTLIIIGVFGMPIYLSEIYLLLETNKVIKKATQKLRQIKTDDNNQSDSYLDVFVAISDDLRMGFDHRVMPVVYKGNQINVLSFLNELTSLGLIKPDKKTKSGSLAHRYYLTRNGATFAKRIKQQEVKK